MMVMMMQKCRLRGVHHQADYIITRWELMESNKPRNERRNKQRGEKRLKVKERKEQQLMGKFHSKDIVKIKFE